MTEPNWLVHCLLLARVTPTVRLQRLQAQTSTLHYTSGIVRLECFGYFGDNRMRISQIY